MTFNLDATNQTLGRLASKTAFILRGKNLPSFTPNLLPETEVVISNISKARFTGDKFDQKKYHHYSGYHSGIKTRKLSELWVKKPEQVFRGMVLRMLPENRMRAKIIKNLKFN
jgi:large subunit ribosomal protein L13